MSIIKLEGISKIYRTKEVETLALENVNLEVEAGEFISIMGPSGCGEIIIETKKSPTSISIIDNGSGISDDIKEKLFTPFFTTKSTGQGIGLLFVREVLFNHNLKFDFRTEDGITTFTICF